MYIFTFTSEEKAQEFIELINNAGIDWMPMHIESADGRCKLYFDCDRYAYGQIRSLS